MAVSELLQLTTRSARTFAAESFAVATNCIVLPTCTDTLGGVMATAATRIPPGGFPREVGSGAEQPALAATKPATSRMAVRIEGALLSKGFGGSTGVAQWFAR
jgi:hypothetical protein